jgi:hypothetical protein
VHKGLVSKSTAKGVRAAAAQYQRSQPVQGAAVERQHVTRGQATQVLQEW